MNDKQHDECGCAGTVGTGLKSVEATLKDLMSSIECQQDTESISIDDALDRILAEDITCPYDFPPWPASAMDGYAFKWSENCQSKPMPIVGTALAGHPFEGPIQPGECIRIMTGAPLPDDTDTVEMQENCDISEDHIQLMQEVSHGKNVRKIGSSIEAGTVIMKAGTKLGPSELSMIASSGVGEIAVYSPLRIAVFTTGDELVQPGNPLAPGQIYDSNRLGMLSVCRRLGYEVIDCGLISDDMDETRKLMSEAAETADVLMTSGGVSVGDADYIKPIVEEIGELSLWKVAIKPGKPIAIGKINDCHFFGLPGNPVSTLVTLDVLVKPALAKLAGQDKELDNPFVAISLDELRKKPGRKDYQRGIASVTNEGLWEVKSTGPQGSGRLSSLVDANCYIVLDEDNSGASVGDKVMIQLFDNALSQT